MIVFSAVSALGGALACGLTHTLGEPYNYHVIVASNKHMANALRFTVTPLDLVKCRRQVNKSIYSGNMDGWRKIVAADGAKGL